MATVTDWVTIKVVLTGREGEPLAQPPGRVMLAHRGHTFAELGDAIDVAFGRWDLGHLHEFNVDGRSLTNDGEEGAPHVEDSDSVALRDVRLHEGTRFRYVFDLGEEWSHDCTVEEVDLAVEEVYGEAPDTPIPVFGWGTLPDQYGRLTEDEDDELDGAVDWDAPRSGDDEVAGEDLDAAEAWDVVQDALAGLPAAPPGIEEAMAAATEAVRAAPAAWPADALLAAANLSPGTLPADEAELWIELAAGVVDPDDPLPVDANLEAAWTSVDVADWAAVVIELVRGGVGTNADVESLAGHIARCPHVEEQELDEDDEAVLRRGLAIVSELLAHLGALDASHRLTALGRWGLPRALARAWVGEGAV
ncbi:hypothetical protein ER308_05280 [Egibacter rhizosphaerae]|uniref:Plasmid pRiA4b Orf3-like domain-containing protein n=1 Tax=Egibacter rhizosphaerae TaxID=1670831 RepID=A0A411YCP1_9ACTN|nr:hypothetical protein [Egibacter rhizosphaerae]QBI19013.1 hypothetical protein ER308_05280 [Egibacter rhizosphaerae]